MTAEPDPQDPTKITIVAPGQTPPSEPTAGETYTKEQLEELLGKARQQEKDKLYKQRSKAEEQAQALADEVAQLRKAAEEAAKAEKERQKAIQDEAKRREEAEMTALQKLERRDQEWERYRLEQEQRYAQIEQQRALLEATVEKERQFNQLQQYQATALANAADDIAPELRSLVQGNTPEEIDASIAHLAQVTQSILSNKQAAQTAAIQGQPGPQVTSPPVGAPEQIGSTKTLTADDLRNMPLGDYAKQRQQFGVTRGGTDRGLFS